ncbi:MAG: hypothetical protein WCH78_03665 [Bacteroidota bacterium]
MKKLLVIAMMMIAGFVSGQGKYEAGMGKAFEQMKDAKTAEDMGATAAFFERIAEAEKDKWLPYYYAAYCNYLTGWMNPSADKDAIGEKSKELIVKAEVLEKNNSELFVLRQMVAVQQLTVDPMSRFQTYGKQANEALEMAKQADPNNPRVYLVDGQYKMNVPDAFGGGKEVGKKLFTKALELFKTFKPASNMNPSWGADQAEKLLAQCQ